MENLNYRAVDDIRLKNRQDIIDQFKREIELVHYEKFNH